MVEMHGDIAVVGVAFPIVDIGRNPEGIGTYAIKHRARCDVQQLGQLIHIQAQAVFFGNEHLRDQACAAGGRRSYRGCAAGHVSFPCHCVGSLALLKLAGPRVGPLPLSPTPSSDLSCSA